MIKPVLLLGNGCRNAPALVAHLCSLGIPVLTTWPGADLIPEDHPCFCGRPGVYGMRAANLIQQKADTLYCFGARLDEQTVCYRYDNFAPNGIKAIWDIDKAELDKFDARGDDWSDMNWDLRQEDLQKAKITFNFHDLNPDWLNWCKALYHSFRPELEGNIDSRYVDPLHFTSALSDYARPDDIIVAGAGKAGEITMQAFKVKAGQRVQTLSTNGAMGYDIPLSIGACLASGRRVLCVTGDGGMMLNVNELEVVRRLKLPIQFFVHSNNGYASIRMMQKMRFGGNVVGADPDSGFTIPPLSNIADCYGLSYQCIQTLERPYSFQATIIELMVDPDYVQLPRVATTMVGGQFEQDDMADMSPKLPPDELREIMEWDGE